LIQYKEMLQNILNVGVDSQDRTGTGTMSVFGSQYRYNLEDGFPLVTTKKTYWKGIVVELMWVLSGDTNIKYLEDNGVKWWREWADDKGDLGPVYGSQWRNWEQESDNGSVYREGYDQLSRLLTGLKQNPYSRRHILTNWNPIDVNKMALPCCHGNIVQFYVRDGRLSCQMYQRSADVFLGVPVNIGMYALLTHLIAADCGLEVGEFIHTVGDLHLYNNHKDQAMEVLGREVLPLPKLKVKLGEDLLSVIDKKLGWEDLKKVIVLEDYNHHPHIKGEVSV